MPILGLYHEQDGDSLSTPEIMVMPKQKSEVNKTTAVKEILNKNPKTPTKEIVSTLAGQGIKISESYVYMLKGKMKAKKRKEKRQKAMAVSTNAKIADPVELIRDLKALAVRAGGLPNLKQLVDVLAE